MALALPSSIIQGLVHGFVLYLLVLLTLNITDCSVSSFQWC